MLLKVEQLEKSSNFRDVFCSQNTSKKDLNVIVWYTFILIDLTKKKV